MARPRCTTVPTCWECAVGGAELQQNVPAPGKCFGDRDRGIAEGYFRHGPLTSLT